MHDSDLTRREATIRMIQMITAAGLAVPALPSIATAAARRQPAAPGVAVPPAPANAVRTSSPLERFITKGRTRERTLRIEVNLDSYQTPVRHIRQDQMPDIRTLKFESAAVVFPVLRSTASSETDIENVKGVLSFDDRPRDVTPTYNEDYPCGTRLAKWELKDLEGREAKLALELPITAWEVEFDEEAATKFPWPTGKWGRASNSSFQPQMYVDRDRPEINLAIDQWTGGKNPQSLPPVQLAKFLCGKIVENIQPSGLGYYTNKRNGQFAGIELKGAAQTLIDRRGTEHDIACLLAAVYRNAGLPARTVIGHDLSETKGQRSTPFDKNKAGGGPHLRSWVEFCLYDPGADMELWIPVDPARIRGTSSRVKPLDKPWNFFGSHDELDDVLPFAFQYHPPTTVVAHGAPAFWGWMTIPETQIATQWLKFSSISTPNGPGVKRPTH